MSTQHIILFFVNATIHAGTYAFLTLIPFKLKMRYSPFKTNLFLLIWAMLFSTLDILTFEIGAPFPQYKEVASFIAVAMTIGFMVIVVKSNFLQLLFTFFVVFTFQNNNIVFAKLIYAAKPFPIIMDSLPELNFVIYSLICLLCAVPLLWYLLVVLLKTIVDAKIDFLQWKFLFLLPFSYFMYCNISIFGGIDRVNPRICDFIIMFFLNTFAYFAYVVVLKMLITSYENYKYDEEIKVAEKQISMQNQQYEKLAETIENNTRLRHDWRHHLLLIKSLADAEKIDELKEYLSGYFTENIPENEKPICSNHSVDIILKHFLAIAKENNVTINVSVNIPKSFSISDNHLCIIFGNLVENSVEACKKITDDKINKFIEIKASPFGEQLAIMVKNSYNGMINKKGELFLSTKHDGTGIGLSSVKNIAKSCGGSFRISHDKGVFKVSVLLNS